MREFNTVGPVYPSRHYHVNRVTLYIADQLLRSGTSPAPNHGEARSAESTADVIHKLKISAKELNESEVWMRIIIASDLIPAPMLEPLLDGCIQLQRILNTSIKTARHTLDT